MGNMLGKLTDHPTLNRPMALTPKINSPGRFLAGTTVRLLAAHAILYYEVEPLPERTESKWVGGSPTPLSGVTVRIRRRKGI